MPTIEFNTYNNEAYENVFRPIPAGKMLPDWWKRSKVHGVQNGTPTVTLRACPAMHDWLATGYYICTSRDIWCEYHEEDTGGYWNTYTPPNEDTFDWARYSSPTHHKAQLMDDNFSFIQGDGSDNTPHDAFKFRVSWMVTTPPGYSAFYLDPFLFQNKYFRTWQGIMDTDMFNNNTDNSQVIVYPLAKHSFIIPKDTPIVQVVPFRRESWVASYGHKSDTAYLEEMNSHSSNYGDKRGVSELCRVEGDERTPDNQIPGGFYRKYMWTSKNKLYKDSPEIENSDHAVLKECPVDHATGELKKDFNDRQRELTDLNWDGSESKKIDRD